MGILKNVSSGEEVMLLPQHTFGRRAGVVNTAIMVPSVSQNHATIQWDGERWVISDHSRNGTWVGDKFLHRSTPGGITRGVLTKGNIIRFCQADDASCWEVTCTAPPGSLLMPLSAADLNDPGSLTPIPLQAINALPSEDDPQKILRRTESGAWLLESGDDVVQVDDGDVIRIGALHWQLHCSGAVDQTIEMNRHNAIMEFAASLDEEHIHVRFNSGGEVVDFGERVHHYILLLLARKWLEDCDNGFNVNDCGWLSLSALATMSGVQPASLNMQIFRLRKQFIDATPEGTMSPDVMERRRGEIRFAYPKFRIFRGVELEREYL